MTTLAQAKTAIEVWVTAQSGVTTDWGGQRKHQQDALPYVSLQVVSNIKLGKDYKSMPDSSTVLRTQTGQREVSISLTVYANAAPPAAPALQALENLEFSLDDDDQIDTFKAAGIGFRTASEPTDVSFLQETEFLEAAEMTVTFGYQVTDPTIDVNAIDQIDDTVITFEQPGLSDFTTTIDEIGPV